MTVLQAFTFLDPGPLEDGELSLVLFKAAPPEPERRWIAPYYVFHMRLPHVSERIGHLSLRVSNDLELTTYGGHIGYRVEEPFRGHHYAERSCRLVLPLAKRHGLDPLWITCNPDNLPSRRTCERLGAECVEIVEIPPHRDEYAQGDRYKARYRLHL